MLKNWDTPFFYAATAAKFAYRKQKIQREFEWKIKMLRTRFIVHEIFRGTNVKKVEITDVADITITFDNGIVIESFVDFSCQDYELFRFFKCKKIEEPHYVVKYLDENIVIEKVISDGKTYKVPDSKKLLKLKAKLKITNT